MSDREIDQRFIVLIRRLRGLRCPHVVHGDASCRERADIPIEGRFQWCGACVAHEAADRLEQSQ